MEQDHNNCCFTFNSLVFGLSPSAMNIDAGQGNIDRLLLYVPSLLSG